MTGWTKEAREAAIAARRKNARNSLSSLKKHSATAGDKAMARAVNIVSKQRTKFRGVESYQPNTNRANALVNSVMGSRRTVLTAYKQLRASGQSKKQSLIGGVAKSVEFFGAKATAASIGLKSTRQTSLKARVPSNVSDAWGYNANKIATKMVAGRYGRK